MADPKKPSEKTEQIPAGEQTYPTPPLDPNTGAPIDTRFQPGTGQPANTEEAAAEQPPKSEEKQEKDDEEEDKKPKGATRTPRHR